MFNILKQVAKAHQVTLVCFDNLLSNEEDLGILRSWCEHVVIVPEPKPLSRSWLKKIADLPRREPLGLAQWYSPRMREILRDLAQSTPYELIHVDHVSLTQYVDVLKHLPCVLTHHNVEGVLLQRQLSIDSNASRLKHWTNQRERRRWVRYEIESSKRVHAIVTVSEQEAKYFKEHKVDTPAFVVQNGVDTALFQPSNDSRVEYQVVKNSLLFTGQMNYAPNVDAMIWFCTEILPLIHRVIPTLEVLIVGRDPTPEVQALCEVNGVAVTGRVRDVRPFYQQATVFIVPMRVGGGTRLKILEAMSMGTPIVSTDVGCEGLDLVPGTDLLVANSPADFAAAVANLIENRNLRDQLATHARKTVMDCYDWNSIAQHQEAAYQAALASI